MAMKKTIIALLFISSPFATFAGTDSCKDQLLDIAQKNESAKSRGDSAAIARLNTARYYVETYCSDEQQASRAALDVSNCEMKVKRAELELQEAQQDLAEAKADGRTDRISKKTHKVEEKKLRLESAKLDLKEAQADAQKLN